MIQHTLVSDRVSDDNKSLIIYRKPLIPSEDSFSFDSSVDWV